ncbi:pepsin-like aspartic protease [Marilutibacter chinensis]|uniref:A1 family peptidase n=1 Tax=Marilutibacter chinensis TaxID=2912247 RepID=A0ABS9HS89_9GAMM|nr:pepsin-like aspartic protease [Lysobacter chinensis]MCF7221789.1 A1 family peptidase [Lysobacter chinensis]MCF7223725.1 A1 family peptidase [Lysobacter chinensis]
MSALPDRNDVQYPGGIHLAISLAWAKGAYTVPIAFGSGRRTANLVLDTGSSTLVVLPHAYLPEDDEALSATAWAQEVRYGQGTWAGPVVRTRLAFGHGAHACGIDDAEVSVIEAAAQDFRDADGIFGLAYSGLDIAHDMGGVLSARGADPALTWPWPFEADDDDLDAFGTLLRQQPRVALQPLFSQLAGQGRIQDRFGMLVRRALVHVLDDAVDDDVLDADPLNRGVMVLGGGEDAPALHTGRFQDVRIVHDLYYNANLLAVQVGDRPRIAVPPLDPQYARRAASNAILDTGSSFLVLEAGTHDAIMAGLTAIDPRLPALCGKFRDTFNASGHGVANAEVDALDWPVLTFHLEGEGGSETALACPPEHYWPRNAMYAGESFFLLMPQLPGWPNESILGLPLMAGHYCLFDRCADGGVGRVRIAPAHPL